MQEVPIFMEYVVWIMDYVGWRGGDGYLGGAGGFNLRGGMGLGINCL